LRSKDGSGSREDISLPTKISQLKKYLSQKKYIHHPQFSTPTRAMLRNVSSNSEQVEQVEDDEVEDDSHLEEITDDTIFPSLLHKKMTLFC
jgi:hypothetical protein